MDQSPSPRTLVYRIRMPAWLGSIFFHLLVLLLILFYLWMQPLPASAPGERNATGGIVIARDSQEGRSYVDSENNEYGEASPQTGDEPLQAPTLQEALTGEFSELDLREKLPDRTIGPQAAGGTTRKVPGAAEMADALRGGSQTTGLGYQIGGKASVQVFGVEGKATSFVYVFDKSGSMLEYGGRPMRAAKAELIKSLEPLGNLHKFNIIFYNERPMAWKPGRKLVFANDVNKAGAVKFVEGTIAGGGTKHYPALMDALSLGPEVIFYLTDGDENDALRPGQLEEITKRNGHRIGAQINVIQFGVGQRRESAFLKRLASQNRGQYKYIDVNELQ